MMTVLADGGCPLCRRSVSILRALDWRAALSFADATDETARRRVAPGLSREAALAQLHVIDAGGRRTAGYDAFLTVSAALPLLWLPGLLGRIPLVAAVGRRAYRFVASHRRRDEQCPCTGSQGRGSDGPQ